MYVQLNSKKVKGDFGRFHSDQPDEHWPTPFGIFLRFYNILLSFVFELGRIEQLVQQLNKYLKTP